MGNPIIPKNNTVVAFFESHNQAEDSVRELQKCGFGMMKLLIIIKDFRSDEHVVDCYNGGDRMKY